ncbi:hypothetical protein ACMAY7_08115 [Rhodobacteraceae bacterium nBUS_24]
MRWPSDNQDGRLRPSQTQRITDQNMRFLYSIWRSSQVFMHRCVAEPLARRVQKASVWHTSNKPKQRAASLLIPVYASYITTQFPRFSKGRPKAHIAGLPVHKTRLQKGE